MLMMPIHAMASGIEGEVIIRPVSPVERPGTVNHRPYQASIRVFDADGRLVTEFRSGADGRFAVRLDPGAYVLRPASEGMYPQAPAQTVIVQKSRITAVQISYDSGIR
jgi:hypothetical protein